MFEDDVELKVKKMIVDTEVEMGGRYQLAMPSVFCLEVVDFEDDVESKKKKEGRKSG